MKKLLFLITLICVLCVSVQAAGISVVDDADLLTDAQETALSARLNGIRDAYGTDVVVVTTDSTNGKSPMAYADDYYDYNGYGADGVLLLISMEDRDWWISTSGMCIDAINDSDIEYIGDLMVSDLSNGDYAAAFDVFADECEYYINGAINGFPYEFGVNLVISLAVGLVIALIVVLIMKGQLKSVRAKDAAGDYVRSGSMQVTQAYDFFLYRNVTRQKKPESSSTHTGSSGRSHGGGGGKF